MTRYVELKHVESKLNHVCRSERIPERRPEMFRLQLYRCVVLTRSALSSNRTVCSSDVMTHVRGGETAAKDRQPLKHICNPAKRTRRNNPSSANTQSKTCEQFRAVPSSEENAQPYTFACRPGDNLIAEIHQLPLGDEDQVFVSETSTLEHSTNSIVLMSTLLS